jgi:hypothetical protein
VAELPVPRLPAGVGLPAVLAGRPPLASANLAGELPVDVPERGPGLAVGGVVSVAGLAVGGVEPVPGLVGGVEPVPGLAAGGVVSIAGLVGGVEPVPGLVVGGVVSVAGLAVPRLSVRGRRVRSGTGLAAAAPFCGGRRGNRRLAEARHGWPSRRQTMKVPWGEFSVP